MTDLQSQRSKLCFLGLSLFSDLNTCKKNIDHKMSGFWDRAYVRFFFSGVEGVTYGMRQLLLSANKSGQIKLTSAELSLLREERYEINDHGKVNTRTAFANFLPSIQFTLRTFAAAYGLSHIYKSAKQHPGWTAFRESVKIRNRLTHPKDVRELMVSGEEFTKIELAEDWFMSLFSQLLEDSFADIDATARESSKTLIAGVDGCHAGWLVISRSLEGDEFDSKVFMSFADLTSKLTSQTLLAVDIPIGLPSAGERECDQEARSLLGKPRSCSVFPAPVRSALKAKSQEEASKITQGIDGRRMSVQLWSLLPKIREVDQYLSADIARQEHIREVHPELSFWAWNGQSPMTEKKKTKDGIADRKKLVGSHFGKSAFDNVRSKFTKSQVADDDICDAFASLWTAERIVKGKASVVPASSSVDDVRLRMEICY